MFQAHTQESFWLLFGISCTYHQTAIQRAFTISLFRGTCIQSSCDITVTILTFDLCVQLSDLCTDHSRKILFSFPHSYLSHSLFLLCHLSLSLSLTRSLSHSVLAANLQEKLTDFLPKLLDCSTEIKSFHDPPKIPGYSTLELCERFSCVMTALCRVPSEGR